MLARVRDNAPNILFVKPHSELGGILLPSTIFVHLERCSMLLESVSGLLCNRLSDTRCSTCSDPVCCTSHSSCLGQYSIFDFSHPGVVIGEHHFQALQLLSTFQTSPMPPGNAPLPCFPLSGLVYHSRHCLDNHALKEIIKRASSKMRWSKYLARIILLSYAFHAPWLPMNCFVRELYFSDFS